MPLQRELVGSGPRDPGSRVPVPALPRRSCALDLEQIVLPLRFRLVLWQMSHSCLDYLPG